MEPYFQALFDIPVAADAVNAFSAVNLFEGYVSEALENSGTGRNYGLDVSVERYFSRKLYVLASGSVYESLYKGSDGVLRPSRYDGRFAGSVTSGYEWARDTKKGKQQVFGFNLRALYRGGLREMPVDPVASHLARTTVFDASNGFTEQMPDYFRLDFRFIFRRNRKGFTSTLSLDIQNLLNTQNVAFRFFDFLQEDIVTRYQLGVIPLLSYRVQF